MQQLVINGSATRLKTILSFIEKLDSGVSVDDSVHDLAPAPGNGNGTSAAGSTELKAVPGGAAESTGENKRTRRTKAEIEADKNAAPAGAAAPTLNDTKTDLVTQTSIARTDGITMDEMKKFTLEKGQKHGQAILAKLQEFGVKRAGELQEKDWNAYWVFLQAL